MKKIAVVFLILVCMFLASCLAPHGRTVEDRRSGVDKMHNETLSYLYQQKTSAEEIINNSVGYAVFSNVNAQYFIVGGGGGYGVVVDKQLDKKTYMKMAQFDLGFGLGAQDVRVVLVFHTERGLLNFLYSGWDISAQGDAVLKGRGKGGSFTGELTVNSDTTVYTMSEAGVMIKLNLAGTKYWIDEELSPIN